MALTAQDARKLAGVVDEDKIKIAVLLVLDKIEQIAKDGGRFIRLTSAHDDSDIWVKGGLTETKSWLLAKQDSL